jgi:hypothetical protein
VRLLGFYYKNSNVQLRYSNAYFRIYLCIFGDIRTDNGSGICVLSVFSLVQLSSTVGIVDIYEHENKETNVWRMLDCFQCDVCGVISFAAIGLCLP